MVIICLVKYKRRRGISEEADIGANKEPTYDTISDLIYKVIGKGAETELSVTANDAYNL